MPISTQNSSVSSQCSEDVCSTIVYRTRPGLVLEEDHHSQPYVQCPATNTNRYLHNQTQHVTVHNYVSNKNAKIYGVPKVEGKQEKSKFTQGKPNDPCDPHY